MLVKIKRILLDDCMDNVTFLGGVSLLVWTWMAYYGNGGMFFTEFAGWYPIGGPTFWFVTHLVTALALIIHGFVDVPKRIDVAFSFWLTIFWGWQWYVRFGTSNQVGNANNAMMVVIGLMMYWRTTKES